MKYGQELPKEVEARLDAYIDRIKKIEWFKPKSNLDKSEIEKQVSVVLKGFGVEASIEYKSLKTPEDWNAARNAALDAALDAARGAALGAAWNAAWNAALGAAWNAALDAALDAARGAAWNAARNAALGAAWNTARNAALDAARGAYDELLKDNKQYSSKYPNGSFINLIPLYEMGLYPIGVVNGKFLVFIPE